MAAYNPPEVNKETQAVTLERRFFDAFGRMRVSEPQTLFDSKQLYGGKSPLFWDEALVGGGSSVGSAPEARTRMVVTGAGDSVKRRTYMRFNYQPGKSQLVYMTGILGQAENTNRRIGQFDDDNGLFIENNGTETRLVIRKGGNDTVYKQSDWNLDKLDGTNESASNPSGLQLDVTKNMIFGVFYEWLGLGGVWFFVVIGGNFVLLHFVDHSNASEGVYMGSPNLPLSYEISSTGGVGTVDHICSTVISEGGAQEVGIVRGLGLDVTDFVNASAAGTFYPLIGYRQQSGRPGAVAKPNGFSIQMITNDDIRWLFVRNPTFTGPTPTYAAVEDSSFEVGMNDGGNPAGITIANAGDLGQILSQGYLNGNGDIPLQDKETGIWPGVAINGDRDEFWLVAQPRQAGADILAALTYREIG